MTQNSLSKDALVEGIDRLARVDGDVARALERVGYPAPRQRESGFATLLRIMVAQQLSTKSAAAIWARVEQAQSQSPRHAPRGGGDRRDFGSARVRALEC
jgi:DNA-3-methyladenine glycosylase II